MKFHNRHRTSVFRCIVLILLVAGCVPATRNPRPLTATNPPPVTLAAPTATSSPLPTVENTLTPTAQARQLQEEVCIPVEENLPQDLALSGVWVRGGKKPYLEPSGYRIPLKGGGHFSTGPFDMAISPDGKYLAYIDSYLDETGQGTSGRILRIVDGSGRSLPMDFWTINWQWLIGWADNHLAVLTDNQELFLLDPLTGKWENRSQPSWLGNMEITRYAYQEDGPYYYSPSLNSVLIQSGSNLELRDFQSGETIFEANGDLQTLGWSAGGSTAVIGLYESLTVVTKDRQVIELDTKELGVNPVLFSKLSSDGQKLAFTGLGSGKWFLLDVTQQEFRKLCSEEFGYWGYAVWSPDNRFVIQEVSESNSGEFDLLIDTQEMHAYKLASGSQHRQAWLIEP